jgi:hypothetical protein
MEAGLVHVFIADSKGERLLSERVRPAKQGESELRSLLLLDGASPSEFAAIMQGLKSLAA